MNTSAGIDAVAVTAAAEAGNENSHGHSQTYPPLAATGLP
nr:MAG TPA: hypothetical protein [Caudoviricetes sp.]